jgi:hypothetical protein
LRASVRMLSRCTLLLLAAWVGSAALGAEPAVSDGQQIYRLGQLPSGAALRGVRDNGVTLSGGAAACVTCHRRSGLGSYEGSTVVPPILGKYLFRSRQVNQLDLNLPHIPGYTPNRDAYDDETLARAIRTGVAPGRTLSFLMPRYELDQVSMRALIGYLRQLGQLPVPGVSEDSLDFATIITPEADAATAAAMLSVMQRFFSVQNETIAAEVRPLRSQREIMYRVTRRWRLHVWRLVGAPDTWARQLQAHLTAEPVFAIIGGLGGSEWRPVHEFCEHEMVPCLMPNVDLPVVAERDFYTVYWTRGVLLEADLMAQSILPSGTGDGAISTDPARAVRVVQIFRPGTAGAAAAAALHNRLVQSGARVSEQPLGGPADGAANELFATLRAGDSLVLWLGNADLSALPATLPEGVHVYASGLMAGLETATPPVAWRTRLKLSYPFDLPEQRRVRMNFPLGWFRIQRLPVVDERVQVNTYVACQILAEALGHMLDSFVRDFLVERIEMILSSRLTTGYFPHLGLAPGQRFASKGGYMVHFAESSGPALVADGPWTVP